MTVTPEMTLSTPGEVEGVAVGGLMVSGRSHRLAWTSRIRATRPSDTLDRMLKAAKETPGHRVDIIQFISPLSASITRPWMHLCLVGLAGYLLHEGFVGMIQRPQYGVSRFASFRLDAMVAAQGDSAGTTFPAMADGFIHFLLKGGCQV